MGLHLPDFVRVTIDGTDRTAYVIAYSRHSSLCSFSDTFTLEMSFEIPVIPDPYDTIVIRELYDGENEKVLGGYIIDVIQDFERGSYVINGQDKTLLLDDYFIHTQNFANNETVGYWMSWYAGLVGLSVQYDSSVSQFFVEEGTPMGMQTASEGISMLERLAAVYIKYDAEIDKLRVFRINTSEPVINITNDETTAFDRELGTEDTRNVVKIYGGQQYNIFQGTTTQVFATARTNIPELIVDKISVMANPHIKRTTVAQIVASRLLSVVDSVDDVVIVETAGFYPFVDVGDYASIDVGSGNYDYASEREITDIQTAVDTNGAVTIFIVGEKCPRVSIMPPLSVVYATATNGGVLVSWDGGDSFDPFNKGIVSAVSEVASGINGLSVAANKHGQLMSIADNTLYKRTGKYGSWANITSLLPSPSNDEGLDIPASVTNLNFRKVEKEASTYGRFHVLAGTTGSGIGGGGIPLGEERWWVYWTPTFGGTWNSMQLYLPGSGIPVGAPSGLPRGLIDGRGITQTQLQTAATTSGSIVWDVSALDIEGGYGGDVTILVGKPAPVIEEDIPLTIYIAEDKSSGNQIWLCDWDGTTRNVQQSVTTSGFLVSARIWSCPSDRDIAYFAAVSNDGPTSVYRGGWTFVWKTTDSGDNWTKIHDEKLIADSEEAFVSTYTVNFDPSSNANEVRVAFCTFYHVNGVNSLTARARFINSDPFGSTTRTDVTSSSISLPLPSLSGGETFFDYDHSNALILQSFNVAYKNACVDDYTWAGTGVYGAIREGPTWTDTSTVAVLVQLRYSTKTVTEYNKKQWRIGGQASNATRVVLSSARSSNAVYVQTSEIPNLSLVSSSSWSMIGSLNNYNRNDFNGYGGFIQTGMKQDYYTVSTSNTLTAIDFAPNDVGYLNRRAFCQTTKQFGAGTTHWCQSDSTVLGEPDGFCYSSDGLNWTQHWSNLLEFWDFDWRTWEG